MKKNIVKVIMIVLSNNVKLTRVVKHQNYKEKKNVFNSKYTYIVLFGWQEL